MGLIESGKTKSGQKSSSIPCLVGQTTINPWNSGARLSHVYVTCKLQLHSWRCLSTILEESQRNHWNCDKLQILQLMVTWVHLNERRIWATNCKTVRRIIAYYILLWISFPLNRRTYIFRYTISTIKVTRKPKWPKRSIVNIIVSTFHQHDLLTNPKFSAKHATFYNELQNIIQTIHTEDLFSTKIATIEHLTITHRHKNVGRKRSNPNESKTCVTFSIGAHAASRWANECTQHVERRWTATLLMTPPLLVSQWWPRQEAQQKS